MHTFILFKSNRHIILINLTIHLNENARIMIFPSDGNLNTRRWVLRCIASYTFTVLEFMFYPNSFIRLLLN